MTSSDRKNQRVNRASVTLTRRPVNHYVVLTVKHLFIRKRARRFGMSGHFVVVPFTIFWFGRKRDPVNPLKFTTKALARIV